MKIKSLYSSLAVRVISILLIVAVLATALPQPALAQSCSQKYTVQSGDTLSKIANQFNVTIAALASANDLKDPYTIFVGQVLCIPGTATSGSGTSTSTSSNKASFTIVPTPKGFILKLSNFPAKTMYAIRAGVGAVRDGDWTKVGRIRVKKVVTLEKTYKLPKELLKAESLTICLKNVVSDAVLCRRFVYHPTKGR